MSTVPPGRKICTNGTEDNESTDGTTDINNDIENHPHKNEEKRQNGNKEEHNEVNSTEHIPEGGESSSSSALSVDVKKEESTKVEPEVSEKSAAAEPTVSSEPKTETETVAVETAPKSEKDEVKPVEPAVEKAVTVKEETIIPKSEETEKIDKDEKMIEPTESVKIETEVKKEEKIESTTPAPLAEEVKPEEEVKEKTPIEIEKPPTPKRRNDDEEEDGDVVSNGSCAKKIRLEMDDDEKEEVKSVKSATEVKEVTTSKPEPANEPVAKSEVDLPKETDILESISTEIDAQKENELLEDVVDSTLITEKDPINIDVKPIEDSVVDKEVPKAAEEIPATEDLLKTDEPVAIPSDLDFTPDEALNELVSSDILAAIPEQPAVEEVKMSEESANVVAEPVAPADEMNVENTETNNAETENAMESAPIKADEEQMDVDESNSVDAMDL